MIPRDYITEWRQEAPWVQDAQVEQDLILSRALVEIYQVASLAAGLAFRGGTALHKLFLQPPSRYSEDIDLVQVAPGPIGRTLDALKEVLDPWLGSPRRKQKEGRVNLIYRVKSEDQPPLPIRIKIEINSREHFTELGLIEVPLEVNSRWYKGSARVTTYELEELLGTKLRALYQRKKGRDLFDLWHALSSREVKPEMVVRCFLRYLREGGHAVKRANFEQNLMEKLNDRRFLEDLGPLLRSGVSWDVEEAGRMIMETLISRIPGDPWKGAVGSV